VRSPLAGTACHRVARPVPEALRASPELRSGSQSETGWAHTGDRFQRSASTRFSKARFLVLLISRFM